MKKAFIVSDVHGYFTILQKALQEAGFDINNENHVFVSLGDLLDRGEEPLQCLQFVNSLPEDRKILIKGNHEQLMVDMLKRHYPGSHDYHNKTIDTVLDCLGVTELSLMNSDDYKEVLNRFENFDEWINYYNSCINYWEDDNNVFVHGWIPCKYRCLDISGQPYDAQYDAKWRTREWDGALWHNGMNLWEQGVREPNKTIWCGHWHASWGHCNLHNDGVEFLEVIETYHMGADGRIHPYERHDPFEDKGICAMDACTAVTGEVNCRVIDIN